jgi:multiple sugar transport system substrate-binding protein
MLGSLAALPLAAMLGGCRSGTSKLSARKPTLEVWAHAGQVGERRTLVRLADSFNAGRRRFAVHLTLLPEGAYNGQLQAAALAGQLPDVFEFDGPYTADYAWMGQLQPLDELLPATLREDLLPSILSQGTYNKRLYAVGQYDSGLGLFARRDRLTAIGASLPTSPGDAWTVEHFEDLLARLAAATGNRPPLDLKLNYRGEWFTYGFAPALWSAGGGLVSRDTRPPHAGGVLDGSKSTAAMRHIQRWTAAGRVDPNLDDAAFTTGRVALSWVGHWEYPRYRQAVGRDLALLPLPDFGEGARTGEGSWTWGISAGCRHPEAAAEFLRYLLQTSNVLAMSGANGAPPATRSAVARSPLYAQDGPLRLYIEQLAEGYALPRPRTPAYPAITSAFQQAFHAVRDGAKVPETLHRAATLIDRDIADNKGYPNREAVRG